MKDEALTWLDYAEENFQAAHSLLQSGFLNPCLQNVQQAVEKFCKAVLIKRGVKPKRTHSIKELNIALNRIDIDIGLTKDECNFLDSIYLPSNIPWKALCPITTLMWKRAAKGWPLLRRFRKQSLKS